MSLAVRSPATIVDMALYGGAGNYLEWLCLKLMRDKGDTYVISAGDDVLCLTTLFPHPGEDLFEATFALQPAAARHMLALCRVVRLTLSSGAYPAIVTVCRSKAGVRIARACGFEHQADTDLGEVWAYGKDAFGTVRRRGRGRWGPEAPGQTATAANGELAAPAAGGDGATAG